MLDANLIQKLRSLTGAAIVDCQKALQETGGDEAKALEILRKKGAKVALKKQEERVAKDGLVEAYIHATGKVGSMIIIACETDFVAKTSEFKELAHDVAMQVAAMNPTYITPTEVPADILAQEKEVFRGQLKQDGKPEAMWDKIIEGKLNKYYEEVCLVKQKFIKDDQKTVEDLINEKTAQLGEKIEVKKIIRFSL